MTVYHPISGELIHIEDLDDASSFIEDRLFKPSEWKSFYCDEDDKESRTYGIEIELNTNSSEAIDRINVCKELLKVLNKEGRHFHIMRDNSVRNGLELVSAPMTYKYWIENFNVKEINDLFIKLNLYATIDTGLHIHVGIKHTQRIKELYLQLFAISYPLWIHLSDRRVQRIQDRYVSTRYFMEKDSLKKRYNKTIESLLTNGYSKVNYFGLDYFDYEFNDRYLGLNFFNDKTIEFRMFSGTNNFYDIIKYLTLVDVIVKLSDEISNKRVNDVFDLDTFVARTKSDLILDLATKHIRFINNAHKRGLVYYNHFLFLDSHWYEIPLKNLSRKDFLLDKKVYSEYLYLLKNLNNSLKYPESMNYKYDINNLLMNNLQEVVRIDEDIYVIGVRDNTKALVIDKTKAKDYVFLRGVNSSLILHKKGAVTKV